MRLAGYVARLGEGIKCVQGCGTEKMTERNLCEDLSVDGKIILKWVLQN